MTENTDMQQQEKKKKRRLLVILIIIIAVLVAAVVIMFNLLTKEEEFNDDDFYDPTAVTGILPGMSEEEIQAELDRIVEEGMLNINIASEIAFENGAAEGAVNISNSEANHYVIKVAITLDDTEETVYESGGIKPGQYIQYITLDEELEAGTYEATATFTAYTEEELQIVGSVAAKVTLYVYE